MRSTVIPPLHIRGVEFGGTKPLFCVPLVARDIADLIAQAEFAHSLAPDVVEWRADSYVRLTPEKAKEALQKLREILDHELLIFTLRVKAEGGKNDMDQEQRIACIVGGLKSRAADLVDIELSNGPHFIQTIKDAAAGNVRIILSFHDFEATPDKDFLYRKVEEMARLGTAVAKIACMPQTPLDVLRLLEVTSLARKAFPSLPLCTMSMGGLGSLSRVAGFLYGSDMAFAVAREVSAPGQIPIGEARSIAESLLRYA